ncbi:MAG: Hsp20/alpha crystallin family protein [Akkermansiaceae bacterium]|nr:Hsp20/alpha crystallin family protein [Akkermansiaceae bacterium]
MNFLQRQQPDLSWFSELDRFFNPGRALASQPATRESIHETPEAWVLELDLPGFTKDNIDLKANGRTLHLTGETPADRPFSAKVDRQWKIGNRIDQAGITAKLADGVLRITLPKTEAPAPLDIEIQ